MCVGNLYAWVYGCVYIYVCIWRPEVDIRSLPPTFSTLFIESRSLN